ncbi:centrosomal protein of 162 kDa isoform 3-T7 [Spheniscus humboldti]
MKAGSSCHNSPVKINLLVFTLSCLEGNIQSQIMAHRFSKEELDEQFEEFLKESLSDDSLGNSKKKSSILETLGQPRKKETKKKDSVPWWISEEDLDDGDSVLASGPNQSFVGVGLDTLEEQEEKEIFFAKLEQEVSSTIDYSRLNKELDSNDSVLLAPFVRNEKTEKGEEESMHEEKSGSYSEDFEEETDANPAFKAEGSQVNQNIMSGVDFSPQEQEEANTGMLAKVVLLDSQDSTTELQKAVETSDVALGEHYLPEEVSGIEMNEAGTSYGQTTSDMEALHQAYHHIDQSLGDTDQQKLHDSATGVSEHLVQGVSQNNDIYSKNMSTIESDLPTVEELMKPIKGHSCNIRSFDVEPESPVKLVGSTANDLVSHSPFKEHQNNTVWETNLLEKFNREETIFLQTAVNDNNFQRVTEKEIQTSEVQLDVLREKIVQDSLLSRGSKTEQALRSCSLKNERSESMTTKPMLYKNIRSPAPLHKKKSSYGPRGVDRSSWYGKPTSLSKQSFPVNEKKTPKETFKKTSVKSKSPADRARSKEALFATRIIKSATNEPTSKESINRVMSGQSAVNNLGHQAVDYCRQYQHDLSFSPIKSCDRELYLLKRVQVAEEDLNAARDLIQQLTSTVSQKDKEIETKIVELKTQHEKELSRLGQENYVLQSKLRSMEELTQEKRWTHHTATIPVTEEKLAQIQKEIEDQEVIIQGYQQENERLYKQMKELQIKNKKNEEQMFKENQCLMSELIALREKTEKTNIQSRIMQDSEPARNRSFTELISELRAAQKEETKLQEEIRRLKQDKQALEVDLGQAKKERDLAKVQIASTSSEKSYEFKVMEESYKQEITHLKRRLQWYAENQDLLDKDAARLKDAREEIEKLKLEVEKLRAEAGDQCVQQKKRLRDRAADAKRIQDLERQIREMEGILKRRYPNSLPALIYAAAAAEKTDDLSAKTNTVDFLERRIKKLETELEGKDDEAKKSLRAMEQQFQKIKIQYEQRLVELEQLLAYKFMSESPKLNGDKASSTELEQELQNLKKTHQITVKNLQTEIENLKSQNSQLKLRSKKDNKDLESTDSQLKQGNTKDRLLKLNEELATKNREIQDLTKTVEKLQKERMVMLSDNNLRTKTTKENTTEILKKNTSATDKRNSSNSKPFLSIFNDDKIYQPHTFSDSNISEVLQENAQLKEELERLSLEMNQQRVKSQATLAYSENNIRRMQEDTAEYVASLKASHQREVEKILCQHAREHSTSKVAELSSRISTQEILIKHLQEQIGEQQRHQEALLVSQMREELLQREVTKLLEELREAKESQSPEMKHFLCLEKKIKHIETRHAEREQEIQKATQLTQQITEARQTHEVERWRGLAQRKNQELEKFRVELDSILDVLRELQKQGVVIPAPNSSGFSMTDSCWKT